MSPFPLGLALARPEDAEAAAGLAGLGCLAILVLAVLGLAFYAFSIYCWWRIFSKAGYSGAMSLLMLLPGIGLFVMVLILAFGDWPALRPPRDPQAP